MKVRCITPTRFLETTNSKIYDVLSVEKGWYRIVDDSGDDYLYPPQMFEVVETGTPSENDAARGGQSGWRFENTSGLSGGDPLG